MVLIKKALTERQNRLLEVIYDFCANTSYPPTFEEMRENLGVSSNQSIVDLLGKLSRDGYIKKDTGARSFAILHLGYMAIGRPALAPILGTTTVGLPAESIEITGEWRPISSDVARLTEEMFMIKISGDSMINAGVDDGTTTT